uniref:Uncharacterized protein n=1 Tax=Arundo donax TaxID=35708 RepID=A0A0A9E2J5_ARUDO
MKIQNFIFGQTVALERPEGVVEVEDDEAREHRERRHQLQCLRLHRLRVGIRRRRRLRPSRIHGGGDGGLWWVPARCRAEYSFWSDG